MEADETHGEAVAMADETNLRPLHPDQVKVLRVRFGAAAAALIAVAAFVDLVVLDGTTPRGLVTGIAALLALAGTALLPRRRYRAWGYREGADELHIRHGLFKRVLTVVPFGRVQHIDISQGPVERRYDLGTLTLHTAGTRSAAVSLPGLGHGEAERLRDRIRAKIRQDLV